jgi:nucleoside-diphosphate-sugar epimerase
MLKMAQRSTFLVFGATGGTGKHFVAKALHDGHRVRALVRDLTKLSTSEPNLQVHQGSIVDYQELDNLVQGVDLVILMLGDRVAQQTSRVNTAFVKKLVPAMRRQGVKRLLYQAGGLSRPYGGSLTPTLWILRNTLARGFNGQHEDNEAVMEYLSTEADDIEWIVHRAGIYGDGESKGVLERSSTTFSIGNFRDCADYSYRVITDPEAIHTSDFSQYVKP